MLLKTMGYSVTMVLLLAVPVSSKAPGGKNVTKDGNVIQRPGFEHVCVIEGLRLGDTPAAKFEEQLAKMLGVRVQYLETVLTLPDRDEAGRGIADTGGRSDVLFAYHKDDYSPEFNAKRMARGIRWLEDAISKRNNPNGIIYPDRIRKYVPADVRALVAE